LTTHLLGKAKTKCPPKFVSYSCYHMCPTFLYASVVYMLELKTTNKPGKNTSKMPQLLYCAMN